jgi:ubiquinone biosynthesis monooxygenase Coq7
MPKPFFLNNQKDRISEIIRVNHSGELGAKYIYEGQIKNTKDKKSREIIKHMQDQELEHLDYFANGIVEGNSRPSILTPIWSNFGYLLGTISAKIGNESSMLVTEKVEEVIVEHYEEQIEYLEHVKVTSTSKKNNKLSPQQDLLNSIKKFQADELEHQETALAHGSQKAKFSMIQSYFVKSICKLAIFIGKKI